MANPPPSIATQAQAPSAAPITINITNPQLYSTGDQALTNFARILQKEFKSIAARSR